MKTKFYNISELLAELVKQGKITRQSAVRRLSLINMGGMAMATAGIQHLYTVDNSGEFYSIN